MHAGKKKKKKSKGWEPANEPQSLQDLDMQKSFCLQSKGLGYKCPLSPPTAPPLYVELTPSVVLIYWQLQASIPPKRY